MTDISRLSNSAAFTPDMQFPVYDPANQQARKVSGAQIIELVGVGVQDIADGISNRIYPGSFAADPATRPDGSAVQAGDSYFNSVLARRKMFNGTAWALDSVDAAVLAAGTGATLVGWIRAATGAVARTVADWFEDQPSVMDFIPFATRVQIRLRTSTADHTAYIAAAYAVYPVLCWPAGQYRITGLDLTAIYGAGIIGNSWNAGPTFSTAATEIIVTANNTPGIRVAGPVRLENFYVAYSRQQTSLETSSRAVEFNNVSGASIKNIRAYYGNVNFGIPQVAFSGGQNFLFNSDLANLHSYSASGTHFDFRNFSGGGTNCRFGPLYPNGTGSLDFVTPGQAADYAIRLANCSNYLFQSVSVDGLRINTTGVEIAGGEATFGDLRFEACNFLSDTARVFDQSGSVNDLRVGSLVIQNTKWTPNTATSFYIYNTRASVSRLSVDLTYLKSDCALGASGTRRVLFNSASLATNANARVNIGPVHDEGAALTDTSAWTDAGTVSRDMAVFTYCGRKVKEFLQGGRLGRRPLMEFLDVLPADGTRTVGDQIELTSASPDGKPVRYMVTASGTPGTFRPMHGVVGRGTTASRPTLAANDAGWMYIDTTLAANGKPIFYSGTGTTWYDVTGTSV